MLFSTRARCVMPVGSLKPPTTRSKTPVRACVFYFDHAVPIWGAISAYAIAAAHVSSPTVAHFIFGRASPYVDECLCCGVCFTDRKASLLCHPDKADMADRENAEKRYKAIQKGTKFNTGIELSCLMR